MIVILAMAMDTGPAVSANSKDRNKKACGYGKILF